MPRKRFSSLKVHAFITKHLIDLSSDYIMYIWNFGHICLFFLYFHIVLLTRFFVMTNICTIQKVLVSFYLKSVTSNISFLRRWENNAGLIFFKCYMYAKKSRYTGWYYISPFVSLCIYLRVIAPLISKITHSLPMATNGS